MPGQGIASQARRMPGAGLAMQRRAGGRAGAGGGGAQHAYANLPKRLLTRSCLLTFIHLIHSLMLISFENVNYLFNMNFLRWKNIIWRWPMVSFEIRILRIRSFLDEPRKYWLFLGEV